MIFIANNFKRRRTGNEAESASCVPALPFKRSGDRKGFSETSWPEKDRSLGGQTSMPRMGAPTIGSVGPMHRPPVSSQPPVNSFDPAQLGKTDAIEALREASRVRITEAHMAGAVGGSRANEGEGLRQVARSI